GRTRAEAARRLGWPEGTVASRLARARALLARRLRRHGAAVSGVLLASALAHGAAPACVPAALTHAALRDAASVAAGTLGVVPERVADLTEGVLRTMMKTKLGALAVVVAALSLFGGAGFIAHGSGGPPAARPAEQPPAVAAALAERPAVPEADD